MGYVVAFNRTQEGYQVPLALAEAGLLDCLCTDFYANPAVWYSRFWKRFRATSRQVEGLDPRLTRNVPAAVMMQAAFLLLGLHRRMDAVDPLIGGAAAKAAVRGGADLFLYSGFAKEAFCHRALRDRRKILFYYHPHSAMIREILSKDMERFPALRNSQRWDPDLSKPHVNRRKDIELMRADMAVCASTFTRRSLESAGFGKLPLCVVP
jgi:hypothetical protein